MCRHRLSYLFFSRDCFSIGIFLGFSTRTSHIWKSRLNQDFKKYRAKTSQKLSKMESKLNPYRKNSTCKFIFHCDVLFGIL
ncbi:hypothetical protein I3843_10G123100 [Carya illinoinensis]|nr:hypothetical protein I3843_10G123100 [Carya illinoinensis]